MASADAQAESSKSAAANGLKAKANTNGTKAPNYELPWYAPDLH